MLILSRHVDEWLILESRDGPIYVHVYKIEAGRVKLGIAAPESVSISRSAGAPDRPASSDEGCPEEPKPV